MDPKIREQNKFDLARVMDGRVSGNDIASDILILQKMARALHKMAENHCNYDLTCPKCSGDGCSTCWHTGYKDGPREARAERRCREIAARYGMEAYFQGDPRGWPVYLIPKEFIPYTHADLAAYRYDHEKETPSAEQLRARWIDSNYNRGYAVCPH